MNWENNLIKLNVGSVYLVKFSDKAVPVVCEWSGELFEVYLDQHSYGFYYHPDDVEGFVAL